MKNPENLNFQDFLFVENSKFISLNPKGSKF